MSQAQTDSKKWFRFSALNLVEHGLTRGADIFISLAIVWGFPTDRFSILATSQAIVAPLLLFFPPVFILYREFAAWKGESPNFFASQLWILRRLGWGMAQLAIALSLLAAWISPVEGGYLTRFWALLWGFAMTAGINVFAPDRELLRLEFKMRALNGLTIYQKGSALVGTLAVIHFFPGRIDLLAGVIILSVATTAWIARSLAVTVLRETGATDAAIHGREAPPLLPTLIEMFRRFSLWNHFSGVIWNWVQTMDLFFLGFFHVPALTLGLYSVALKIANLSLAAPTALGNIFAVWIGRRDGQVVAGVTEERVKLFKYSVLLGAACFIQAFVLYAVAPFVIRMLSRDRWTPEEQSQVLAWLGWILFGSALFASSFLLNWWLTLRSKVSELFLKVYMPLLIGAALVYGLAAQARGPSGVAVANSVVGAFYILLVLNFLRGIP